LGIVGNKEIEFKENNGVSEFTGRFKGLPVCSASAEPVA
jgi:hypothetical protein